MTERRRGMKFTGDRYQIVYAEESVPVSVAENLWLQTTDVPVRHSVSGWFLPSCITPLSFYSVQWIIYFKVSPL